jgi:HNH endonuclease
MRRTFTPHPTIAGLFLTRDGRVFRTSDGSSFQEFPFYVDDSGYACMHAGKDGKIVRRHTVVAETFIGPRPPSQEVRHLDGIPSNDRANNLAWGTRVANMADMIAHGRSPRGIRHGSVKLTEAQAREIKRRREAGEQGRSLAAEFNITEQTVCDIYKGRHWSWLEEPDAEQTAGNRT